MRDFINGLRETGAKSSIFHKYRRGALSLFQALGQARQRPAGAGAALARELRVGPSRRSRSLRNGRSTSQ